MLEPERVEKVRDALRDALRHAALHPLSAMTPEILKDLRDALTIVDAEVRRNEAEASET